MQTLRTTTQNSDIPSSLHLTGRHQRSFPAQILTRRSSDPAWDPVLSRSISASSTTSCSSSTFRLKDLSLSATPKYAQAILSARRQNPSATQIPVVQTQDGELIDYGAPNNWKAGIASRVQSGELVVLNFPFTIFSEEEEVQEEEPIENAYLHLNTGRERSTYATSPPSRETPGDFSVERSLIPLMDMIEFRAGYDSDKGLCPYQQDGYMYIQNINAKFNLQGHPTAYFAVYDGHGGNMSVDYAQQCLHRAIGRHPQFNEDPALAIQQGFCLFDNWLIERSRKKKRECGVVAVVAILRGNTLYIGHAGDCRAILCRDGQAIELTEDHRATREDERERVEERGGTVEYGTVSGGLSVSRSLGDYVLDQEKKLPGLTALPDIREETITPADEFLILASDGVFDGISGKPGLTSEDAVRIVRRSLQSNNDPAEAAIALNMEALPGTEDNVTVMVVSFKTYPPQAPYRPLFGRRTIRPPDPTDTPPVS